MNKEQVVAVMIEYINNLNRAAAASSGQSMSLSEIEKAIETMQPNLTLMCNGLYDTLLQKNIVIAE